MGLSTHVLDTARGCPAAGMGWALYRLGADGARGLLKQGTTNADGRNGDGHLLSYEELEVGRYQLVYQVAAYYRAAGVELPEPPFLDEVTLAFGIWDVTKHYHVPLLCSPYGYTTYRGS
ncbi:hydroxyisourate hydrolase [Rhodovarius crocodyli]|uniref:5-hydroxyisourate hydrolase n=1 Tax=Rhodovarius crocodyli TaxID=1979269 RepID=A0A437M272_9PROT|nr:hydroxyisourate hydrolase [Rhodovarius crocodyli]RVT91820.1 hydroxyisourate hydrolase [Rhodovarius crocodyli]